MSEDESCKTAEEKLLVSTRTGDLDLTAQLLNDWKENKIELDINCKGNHDWRPLHMACYFGHKSIAESLIKHGADINVLNDTGDTPLHKASYTGREDIVLSLLSRNADVFIRNSEGQTPRCISANDEITKLLKGAENADIEKKNSRLLQAAREGDVEVIGDLLKGDNPPDINCIDSLGNSALHCASYRGKKEVAVLLLQNGIDTSIKNLRGQLAIDLALNLPMKQILGVQPVKHFQKTASRFEGMLLRKSRFLGWKEVYTVLEKGVMSFFNSRADSTTGTRRKGYKYLDGAKIQLDNGDVAAFTAVFSDNTRQRFSVPYVNNQQVDRQKWMNAIIEHVEFSSHYLKQGFSDSDPEDEEDIIPIGTMQDKLQTAQAHLHVFEKGLDSLKVSIEKGSSGDNMTSTFYDGILYTTLYSQAGNLIDSGRKVSASLSHCLTVFAQQEEIRMLQLKQQQEKCRVLQDALHALAQEHHELEKSIVSPYHSSPPNSPHYQDTDCDEFFDAFEGDYSPPFKEKTDDDTISNSDTAVPSETTGYFASFSVSSDDVKNPEPSKWGRLTLPVPQFSRNDFSVWSILKQCIGKELSKITMPIVFNEPISFLQRIAENMEYCHLLEKANNTDNPVERMEYVAAFAIASVASNWERLGKPFNPLLGETYELMREEENFKIVAEQVSHHPPVTAFHADSPNFIFTGAIHPKLKLWARSVEVKPEGTMILKLLKYNESYSWAGVTCCVHNIIVGKLWMEQCGVLQVTCHTNGLLAEVNFKPAGWYSKDLNCIEGFVLDRQKTRHRFLFGKWCSFIKSMDAEYHDDYLRLKELQSNTDSRSPSSSRESSSFFGKVQKKRNSSANLENGDRTENYKTLDDLPTTLLWEAEPRPEWSSEYYNFTYYAMALNEVADDLKTHLPPTDSRLRPDIRKLEEGDIDGAAFEKNRLEEKQREVRKQRKKDRTTWTALWFEPKPHPFAKEESWSFKGDYWDKNFAKSPDIF